MKMIGIIFAGISDKKKYELSANRPASMLPIAANYRAIDFSLSNMVNSGVGKVCVLAQYNTRATSEYLSSPTFWGFGRKQGGLILRSPSLSEKTHEWYRGKVDSMIDNIDYLKNSHEPYVVLAMGDGVSKINYDEVLDYHIKKNAEITVVAVKAPEGVSVKNCNELVIGERKKIVKAVKRPEEPESEYITAGIYVIRRRLLIEILEDAKERKLRSFVSDVLIPRIEKGSVYAYMHKGYWRNLATLDSYIRCNKDFLKEAVNKEFFGDELSAVMTKGNDNPPAKLLSHASVRESLIGEGAIIDGTVERSVIFEGVEIGKGAKLTDCLVLPGARIKPDTVLNNQVIADGEEV